MKAKKAIEEALRNGDRMQVREIILEQLEQRAGEREALEIVMLAVNSDACIYDPDDGSIRILERQRWSAAYADELRAALKRNFSLRGLKLYVDVTTELATNSEARRNGEEIDRQAIVEVKERVEEIEVERLPDGVGLQTITEETVEETLSDEVADITEAAQSEAAAIETSKAKKGTVSKVLGYILLILGAISTIVGLCISLRLLMGLGIVIILLGSAVGYLALSHPHTK